MDDLCIPDLIMSSSHHNDQPKEIKVNPDLCPPPLYRLQSQNHSLYQIDPINIFASMDQFDASIEIHPRH